MASAAVALPQDLRKVGSTNSAEASLKSAAGEALPSTRYIDNTTDGKSDLSLPVIDLTGFSSGDPLVRKELVRQIGNAACEFGFFQVVNHGFPDDVLNTLVGQSKGFFNLPQEVKSTVGKDPNDITFGYSNNRSFEGKGSATPWIESLAQGHAPAPTVEIVAKKFWPDGNPAFCKAVHEYTESASILMRQLLELMAESLGLQTDYFSRIYKDMKDYRSSWRIHRFVPCPDPSRTVGARWHADTGVITLLWQDEVGGLQVKKDNKVIDVPTIPGSFVINIGDSLEAWSNGRFPSVDHQVVLNSQFNRFTVVYFFFAPMDFTVSAPPELIDEAHPARYLPFTGNDFWANVQHLIKINNLSKRTAMQKFLREPQAA